MATIDIAAFDVSLPAGPQQALADARRRLFALANALEGRHADERFPRATAAELDAVVHRIRWVADVTAAGRPVND